MVGRAPASTYRPRMGRVLRGLAVGMSIAVAVAVIVALLGYHTLHGSTAVRYLHSFVPLESLHHDRGYMSTPTGTIFRAEEARCDSGTLFVTRTLHVTSGRESVQGRYEQALRRNGWSAQQEPHNYVHVTSDDHRVAVVVRAPDEHDDLVINAAVDPPCGVPRP